MYTRKIQNGHIYLRLIINDDGVDETEKQKVVKAINWKRWRIKKTRSTTTISEWKINMTESKCTVFMSFYDSELRC